MSKCKNRSFTDQVKFRIKILWGVLVLMLVYMVAVGELGLGDSRYTTQLAQIISNIIFFGGLFCVIFQIVCNKKRLHNKALLIERERGKSDERKQFLHDKSVGVIVDILLLLLLFITCTAALCNMPAFYVALTILLITICLKAGSYLICDKIY